MSSFEERVLIRAKAFALVCQRHQRRMQRGEMSRKSYVEATLRAEANFVEAVAALRQKEGVNGPRLD